MAPPQQEPQFRPVFSCREQQFRPFLCSADIYLTMSYILAARLLPAESGGAIDWRRDEKNSENAAAAANKKGRVLPPAPQWESPSWRELAVPRTRA
jgi:hypothetical protein